jgi:hypothetical protein
MVMKRAALAQSNPPFSSAQLAEQTIHRRAVEAVIWGMPAVNYDLMLQAMIRDAKGAENQIVWWPRLLDWKNQMLTPNPDAIYLIPFYNTKNAGPLVIEIPPADEGSITGSIMDGWQSPLEDVGTGGVDRGKGGKYLILPPDYKDKAPDGYIPLPSETYGGSALLRSILKSGGEAGLARAGEYAKRIKFYPLSQAANPPATTFVDASDVVYEANIPYDLRYFQSLNRFVQAEPWLTRDKVMIGVLKTLGIEKGKPFNPDAKTQEILKDAAQEALALLDARYATAISSPFCEGTQWGLPIEPGVITELANYFSDPEIYSWDERGLLFYFVFSGLKHMGAGQFYLFAIKDRQGKFLDGGGNYRLTVPANPPVTQYWSAVVYDRATHVLIRNLPRSNRSSLSTGLQENADGSVDIYFGPKAPEGKDANWIPTAAGGSYEVCFRFYAPEKPLFEKTWKLPDIEKIH